MHWLEKGVSPLPHAESKVGTVVSVVVAGQDEERSAASSEYLVDVGVDADEATVVGGVGDVSHVHESLGVRGKVGYLHLEQLKVVIVVGRVAREVEDEVRHGLRGKGRRKGS